MRPDRRATFRFAPSPNGRLHLGHAYSALLNARLAKEQGGRLLLRIEDIDTTRCTPQLEQHVLEDLDWLGLSWEKPPRRQSDHFDAYASALERLTQMELIYPSFLTRGEMRAHLQASAQKGVNWPLDPEGTPLAPLVGRQISAQERQRLMAAGETFAWRLNMESALKLAGKPMSWMEEGHGPQGETGLVITQPEQWGDVILARKDVSTSYHLSVVVDDALQQVTSVVRGHDLFHATSVHRLLQTLLDLPQPRYHHHRLILAQDGRKLSKSRNDTAIATLREQGMKAVDIEEMLFGDSIIAT